MTRATRMASRLPKKHQQTVKSRLVQMIMQQIQWLRVISFYRRSKVRSNSSRSPLFRRLPSPGRCTGAMVVEGWVTAFAEHRPALHQTLVELSMRISFCRRSKFGSDSSRRSLIWRSPGVMNVECQAIAIAGHGPALHQTLVESRMRRF
jgi:hypothetical protein